MAEPPEQPPPVNLWGEVTGFGEAGGFGEARALPAPEPQSPPKRAGMAELLDAGFRAVRRTPVPLLLGAACVVSVLTVVSVVALIALADPLLNATGIGRVPAGDPRGDPARALGVVGVVEIATRSLLLAGTLLLSGVLAPAARDPAAATTGRRLWLAVRPRLGALLSTVALIALIAVAVVALAALPGLVLFATGTAGSVQALLGAGLAGLGAITGLALALAWPGVRLSLAPQAVVLDGLGVRDALSRSIRLTRGRYWHVLGVLLLAGVLTWVAQGLLTAPFALVGTLIASTGAPGSLSSLGLSVPQLLVNGLGVIVSASLAFPFLAAVITALFDDLRVDEPIQG